ncbi:Mut7-C RNAse domain-containing protein [Malonomonas rubra]|uniref:Mut7-C RNAse domain-containing protein n=1 Tax=Malonomonas rubra TaxID=57040 RepID=UPI0026F15174|nr:Mut7-C RNAse domain-containing protein [Malonomonas rubra]
MQNCARFKFFGRLQQMVAATDLEYRFNGRPAVKDAIEALGVPHTEVDLLLIAQRSVTFAYQLQDGDRVAVYPFGCTPGLMEAIYLSPPTPELIAFILDVHLGKLARRLRMLGFDCRYRNDYSDSQIIEMALREDLIILTRDRGILKHACVTQGYLVGSQNVIEQVEEVLQRYNLLRKIRPLRRCPHCNGLLEAIDKDLIVNRLPPKTASYYQKFHICGDCEQLYWKGAHYRKIAAWLECLKGVG